MKQSIVVVTLMVVPVVLGFVFDWNLLGFVSVSYTLSVFATLSMSHFIMQLVFSMAHHRKANRTETKTYTDKRVGVQITGWKEDADLFRMCLQSIKNQSLRPTYVLFCSDGNEASDQYLIDIYKEVFPSCIHVQLTRTIKEEPDILDTMDEYKNAAYICISQPHKGKRYAMYTQMRMLSQFGVDYILFIDSDTIVHHTGLEALMSAIEDTQSDAVTGDVRIYNVVNLLSCLVSLKYWHAFNIERSAQSFFDSVSCIAGPFGLYRTSTIRTIMHDWIGQVFMGRECTFGDDRNLTNLILKNNGKTNYTPHAVCYTDTPTTLKRFFSQQTRWGKSFLREYILYFNWSTFQQNQKWLFYDLSFMYIYSLVFTVYTILLHITFRFDYIMLFLSTILLSTLIRGLIAMYTTGNIRHYIFILYGYVYVLLLIPLKVWSGLTIQISGWGTGNRLLKTFMSMDMIPVIVWNVFILTCCTISIANQCTYKLEVTTIASTSLNVALTLTSFIMYLHQKTNIHALLQQEIQREIQVNI